MIFPTMRCLSYMLLSSFLLTLALGFSVESINVNSQLSSKILDENEPNIASGGVDRDVVIGTKRHIPFPMPLPLGTEEYLGSEESLQLWFNDFVDSSPYFERISNNTFTIPLFGASITLNRQTRNINTYIRGKEEESYDYHNGDYVIEIAGADERDYGIIAAKLYESQIDQSSGSMYPIDNRILRQIVKNHFQSLKPNPGSDARLQANNEFLDNIITKDTIRTLQNKGFATIDTNLITNIEAIEKLGTLLKSKTSQESHIRSDTVAFISRDDALECGIGTQYDALMGMAHFFNCHMNFDGARTSLPRLPATIDRPLTNPTTLQIAEYSCGEFYVAHSDNLLLAQKNVRSNYRRWTVILYFNDDWDMTRDGGALRIYPDSLNLKDPAEVVKAKMHFEDINPSNGKLLIFDSRLVHSVERVLTKEKKRIAMTLWINKPEEGAAAVNIWNDDQSKVDWYRLP